MDENTKILVAVLASVILSVSASYMLITPREERMGLTGLTGPQGIQGEIGPAWSQTAVEKMMIEDYMDKLTFYEELIYIITNRNCTLVYGNLYPTLTSDYYPVREVTLEEFRARLNETCEYSDANPGVAPIVEYDDIRNIMDFMPYDGPPILMWRAGSEP